MAGSLTIRNIVTRKESRSRGGRIWASAAADSICARSADADDVERASPICISCPVGPLRCVTAPALPVFTSSSFTLFPPCYGEFVRLAGTLRDGLYRPCHTVFSCLSDVQ